MHGKSRQDSLPFVATPVAADAEVFMDRIRGITLMTAAFSCDTKEKERDTVAGIYLLSVAE